MSKVHKKQDAFYTLFSELSAMTVEAAELFRGIVREYPDSESRVPEMKEYELKCDEKAKQLFEELDNSFVTPFDREDIDALIRMMDDIVDNMQGVALRYQLFAVTRSIPAALEMADLILSATQDIDKLFRRLPNYKHDDKMTKIALRVGATEDKGDVVYHDALGALFHDETEPLKVIKWKTLLDKMEDTLDSCKDVSVVIQGVVMKNA
ncbi:MAG: DUF47 family protein [Atopobiaceae bacterium]|jgi:uncharacterized protein Yka (UPF0111/DUF47 family)|nr:DUF47 family protein [Atopobiaceae bacterium]MCH4179999.1 DUF47 family protein [Atopobiaceae bacterium]MCH4213949.1 DUF47 family protein [Atopobiaceae bacterium]MCH4230175.1 DUF47 family protein [Atopobiaceae bacterium]MCH4275588.1 DUF47 family protein [Atopobiaceae bacterium]